MLPRTQPCCLKLDSFTPTFKKQDNLASAGPDDEMGLAVERAARSFRASWHQDQDNHSRINKGHGGGST